MVSFVDTAAQFDVLDELVVAAVQSFDVRRCGESGRLPGLFAKVLGQPPFELLNTAAQAGVALGAVGDVCSQRLSAGRS